MNKKARSRLATNSYGLLLWRDLRSITHASGYRFFPSWFGSFGADKAVWGRVPRAERQLARHPHSQIVTFEDAFLRSAKPGPTTPPLGLTCDHSGVHFDGQTPSDLEISLQAAPALDDTQQRRAQNGIAFLRQYGLSKYNLCPRGSGLLPKSGYVLVIDQVRGDASIRYGGASDATFRDMLAAARADHPDKPIIIRTHPATDGQRPGHFGATDIDENTKILDHEINPWDMIEGASAIYAVTSLMGFEAILAGKSPTIFGRPFYAGWGLSEDVLTCERRTAKLSKEQLFTIAMIDYPIWFDRCRNQICEFETAALQLLAQARHYWLGKHPTLAMGMRAWKRKTVARFLSGNFQKIRFSDVPPQQSSQTQIIGWASRLPDDAKNIPNMIRVEDGFIRSAGLGAKLTPPGSLVFDDLGIYYDPSRESRLERLIQQSDTLPEGALDRAEALRKKIVDARLSKYNLEDATTMPALPKDQTIILVPGQVEDDASILTGTSEVRTNTELLDRTRAANPDAYIIYKPHPDVAANLRDGGHGKAENADITLENIDISVLLESVDEVWTMTSLTGFEALLRGKRVTCFGQPFYAGWGLTTDIGPVCARRSTGKTLSGLIHAALIDYPHYMDPVTNLPCPAELAVERLARGTGQPPFLLRLLSKLQSRLARFHFIWR